ncbi:MAG TPA: M20/M25/M40 family metallo-hydrolase [Polyangiaceae bacterium]|nr:M20/M25/M40 family metallo-hydrolase [Polyangiaceae bacterium]
MTRRPSPWPSRWPVVSLLLAACGAPTAPRPAAAPAVVATAEAAPALAYTLASSLSTEVGPRLAGSPNDARAVAWAVRTLAGLGFTSVRTEPVSVPVWRRVRERATLTAGGVTAPLAITALGWSVSGDAAADVVEVGEPASMAALPEGSLRGKIVFCNVHTDRAADGAGYGRAVGVRAGCPREAEARGALAALVRSVGTDATDAPHTGSMRQHGAKIPGVALSAVAADRLHVALLAGRASVSLSVVTEAGPDATSANVVAEVRGTRAPGEIVVVGAHLDAWDLGRGAVDDGAGVGVVIAAARAFLRAPPERTLRVVLFAAEENSLAGAKAYAAAHAGELERHVAALELDAGTGRVLELRARAGEPVALPAVPGVVSSREPAEGGADLIPLRAAGVPVLDARQDMSTYFDVHHTARDTPDQLREPDLAQATAAVVALLRFATASSTLLARIPAEERARPSHETLRPPTPTMRSR